MRHTALACALLVRETVLSLHRASGTARVLRKGDKPKRGQRETEPRTNVRIARDFVFQKKHFFTYFLFYFLFFLLIFFVSSFYILFCFVFGLHFPINI